MLIIIGVGLCMLGLGVFIGKYLVENVEVLKIKKKEYVQHKQQQQLEKNFFENVRHQAKLKAIVELQPYMMENIKKTEIKKMSITPTDKLEKFGKMFSMGDTSNKVEKMLGNITLDNLSNDKILNMSSMSQNTKSSDDNMNNKDSLSIDKINQMLGLRQQKKDKDFFK